MDSQVLIDTLSTAIENNTITFSNPEPEFFLGIPISVLRILIPAVISILLFFLGFFINWLNKKRERKNALQSTKTIVFKWSELLKKPIMQQINYCREFAKDLRESDYISTERLGFVSLLVDRLNEITLTKYTDTFVLNHKGNERENSGKLYNLISSFEYFTNFGKELERMYGKFEKDTREIMNQWNQAIRDLDNLKQVYAEKIGAIDNHPSRAFYNEFVKIGAGFQQKYPKGATISQMQESIINKLTEESNKFLKLNNTDVLAIEVLNLIAEIKIIIKQWNKHKLGYSYLFLDYGLGGIKTYKAIVRSIKHFDSISLKSIIKIN